jgi:hypothetical protein
MSTNSSRTQTSTGHPNVIHSQSGDTRSQHIHPWVHNRRSCAPMGVLVRPHEGGTCTKGGRKPLCSACGAVGHRSGRARRARIRAGA